MRVAILSIVAGFACASGDSLAKTLVSRRLHNSSANLWDQPSQEAVPEGCYDIRVHKCDCSIVTEENCNVLNLPGAPPSFFWTPGCESCEKLPEPKAVPDGCYDIEFHQCNCDIPNEQNCLDLNMNQSDPIHFWTPGCASCVKTNSNEYLPVSSGGMAGAVVGSLVIGSVLKLFGMTVYKDSDEQAASNIKQRTKQDCWTPTAGKGSSKSIGL